MSIDDIEAFKQGNNCIKVSNPLEFSKFKALLYKEHMTTELKWVKKHICDWTDLVKLGHINNKHNPHLFLFEFQPDKGLSWYDDEKEAEKWFGCKPAVF